jgi:flagellar hook-length control protein FliK
VGTEKNLSAAKEALPVQSSPSSPAVVNPAGDEAVAALRSPTSPTGEGSAVDADLELVPTIDRARFVQRVSRAFQTAHAREGQIQLRLSPPELGSLRISITVHEGVVSAKVEVETAAARNVLLDNLPALRERLAEQEIRIEKFDVDVRRDGGQETDNSGPNDRQARQTRADSAPSPGERDPGDLKTTPSARHVNPINTVTDGRLDVRI